MILKTSSATISAALSTVVSTTKDAFLRVAISSLFILPVACPAGATEVAMLSNGFSIRHEHRAVIGTTTRLFLSSDNSSFMDVPTGTIASFEKDLSLPAPSALETSVPATTSALAATTKPVVAKPKISLNEMVNLASAQYSLDPDLVSSVIHAESGFNAHAVSPKGARGLMQLMPQTASKLGVNDSFDPQDNVAGGSRYLRELLERYNFDLVKALAAYNAGPQRVEQYRGVPPFRETRAYVARIVHEYNTKKIAEEKEEKKQLAAAKAARKASKQTPTLVAANTAR
jgi:hypothetical protein